MLTDDIEWMDKVLEGAFYHGPTTTAWGRIKKALAEAETQSATPTNSDYTAALNEEIQRFLGEESFSFTDGEILNLAARLNSVVKAQQNCA